MSDDGDDFRAKAEESLATAETEYINGRYNSCANRCYYACFQAAVSALIHVGILPVGLDTHIRASSVCGCPDFPAQAV